MKKQIHQITIADFEKKFPNELACRTYLQENRWPNGIACPRCENVNVYEHSIKEHHWQCAACSDNGYRFSVLVGTIFENTNKPLRDWFRVMHMMLSSEKAISALQIYRVMAFGSYNTAHLMCSKIRIALGNEEFKQLVGVVEVDETLISGKIKNKLKDKRGGPGGTGSGGSQRRSHGGNEKIIVASALSRKGNVVARVVDNVSRATLTAFVRKGVSHKVPVLCADAWTSYSKLGVEYPHAFVDHYKGEYVVGAVHTNTVEGLWSIVKCGIIGTFHKVSANYLPLYANEFEFRYNHRNNQDIFGAAIRAC